MIPSDGGQPQIIPGDCSQPQTLNLDKFSQTRPTFDT